VVALAAAAVATLPAAAVAVATLLAAAAVVVEVARVTVWRSSLTAVAPL
jgi:hypothetical protein